MVGAVEAVAAVVVVALVAAVGYWLLEEETLEMLLIIWSGLITWQLFRTLCIGWNRIGFRVLCKVLLFPLARILKF